ncbi:MAG: IS630 family transposase [Chloroflexi bacterium]|nr:IS630 family transposase [Chloroflexota bacterium]
MIEIEFTEEEIEKLHYEHLHNSHPRVRQRCEVVYLKALGYSHQEIGRIVRVSQPTVREYLEMYQTGGLEKLKELDFHKPTSELDEYIELLKAEFEAHPPATINEAGERIGQLTGIRRSPTQVGEFLIQKLGMKRLKVGQIPAKADPEEQKTFLENELQPRLEEAKQGKRHVFFMDASHFVLQPFLGFLWCFTRVFVQAPSGRQRFNVLGAIHAISLQVVTFTNETYINAESVAALLHQIATAFADLPITIVLDNARYQRCRFIIALAAGLGIELLFLPPYSPNLNLIERLWKFVKKECLYSKYYEKFEPFKNAIIDCLAEADGKHKQKLSSLLTLNFQTF